MRNKEFPYQKYLSNPAWQTVDHAIERLASNADLIEKTERRYIVGFILKQLVDEGFLNEEKSADSK